MREKSSRFCSAKRAGGGGIPAGAGGEGGSGAAGGNPGTALGSKTCNRTKGRKQMRKQGGTAGEVSRPCS